MDILTPEERSQRMRLVKSKGTNPERAVRQIIRRLDYKYRSHLRTLPGSPDFVFREQQKVIFVHGCFWHQHTACRKDRKPRSTKSRREYWGIKLIRNKERDLQNQRRLKRMGWNYLVLWECRVKNKSKLTKLPARIKTFMEA